MSVLSVVFESVFWCSVRVWNVCVVLKSVCVLVQCVCNVCMFLCSVSV